MNCISKTIDTLDGKTLQVDVLPSGDVQLTLFDWRKKVRNGSYYIETDRFGQKLGTCILSAAALHTTPLKP